MTVSPLVKRKAMAALTGFAAGALLWLLASQIYAKAQGDAISVDGCAQSLGMDPMLCQMQTLASGGMPLNATDE
jgi:hypothetical protein